MPNRPRTDFGKRLRDARKAAQLSQVQLGQLAGLSQSNVAELESVGQGSAAVTRLAAALKVDAHWLATGEGQKEPLMCPLSPDLASAIARLPADHLRRLEAQLRVQLDVEAPEGERGNARLNGTTG